MSPTSIGQKVTILGEGAVQLQFRDDLDHNEFFFNLSAFETKNLINALLEHSVNISILPMTSNFTSEQILIFEKALKTYGFDSQLDQLTEELAELIVACNKVRRKAAYHDLADEMADVLIMIHQIMMFNVAGDLHKMVQQRLQFKINRLNTNLKKYENETHTRTN